MVGRTAPVPIWLILNRRPASCSNLCTMQGVLGERALKSMPNLSASSLSLAELYANKLNSAGATARGPSQGRSRRWGGPWGWPRATCPWCCGTPKTRPAAACRCAGWACCCDLTRIPSWSVCSLWGLLLCAKRNPWVGRLSATQSLFAMLSQWPVEEPVETQVHDVTSICVASTACAVKAVACSGGPRPGRLLRLQSALQPGVRGPAAAPGRRGAPGGPGGQREAVAPGGRRAHPRLAR